MGFVLFNFVPQPDYEICKAVKEQIGLNPAIPHGHWLRFSVAGSEWKFHANIRMNMSIVFREILKGGRTMRCCLIRVTFSTFFWLYCAVAFAQTPYQVTEIPDEVNAQYLLRDGQILGFDWMNGIAILWSAESGITPIPAPDGDKWRRVTVSPGGRFLGASITPDGSEVYYEGQIGFNLSPVSWPTSLPRSGSIRGAATVGATVTICVGPCPPDPSPPIYIPQTPRYYATAINDDGVIAGRVSIDRNTEYRIFPPEFHAFRLYPKGRIDVLLEEKEGQAMSINSRGDVLVRPRIVGFCASAIDVRIWTAKGLLISPAPLQGYESLVWPILNDRREIAGGATNEDMNSSLASPAFENMQGFIWNQKKGTRVLDLLPGYTSEFVNGLNNQGRAVGQATNYNTGCFGLAIHDPALPEEVAVLWKRNGHVIDLNTVIKKKHWPHASTIASLTNALAINDSGQILASGVNRRGDQHTYLLSPRK